MANPDLKHRELTQKIIGVFFEVYNELGHGFLESVYEAAFQVALVSKGMSVFRQIEVPVWFRGQKIGNFTAEMLAGEECASRAKGWSFARSCTRSATPQLPPREIEVGILFSFRLKPEFKRLAYDNIRKQRGERPGLLERFLSTGQ